MASSKVILWDLDGTILDSFGVFTSVLSKVLPAHGFTLPTSQVLRQNYHGSLQESIVGALGGVEPEVVELIAADFLQAQDSEYADAEAHLLPDALRLMKRAHQAGFRQVIVTTRGHAGRKRASPRHITANSQLKQYIDMIICGDDSEFRKPDAHVVDSIAGDLKSAEVLVIGDQHVDAELARNLHTKAILVCRDGGQPPHMESLADWRDFVTIVRSLDEVSI